MTIRVLLLQPGNYQKQEERLKQTLRSAQKEAALPTPGSQTSEPQNCETINPLVKPPSLWYSVTATLGN